MASPGQHKRIGFWHSRPPAEGAAKGPTLRWGEGGGEAKQQTSPRNAAGALAPIKLSTLVAMKAANTHGSIALLETRPHPMPKAARTTEPTAPASVPSSETAPARAGARGWTARQVLVRVEALAACREGMADLLCQGAPA